jgi:hypothetical protein
MANGKHITIMNNYGIKANSLMTRDMAFGYGITKMDNYSIKKRISWDNMMDYSNGMTKMAQSTKQDFMLDKEPLNDKGDAHGIWESYYDNGQLHYKGEFINGIRHGLWEGYYYGQICFKINYINGQFDGLCQLFNLDGTPIEISFYAK